MSTKKVYIYLMSFIVLILTRVCYAEDIVVIEPNTIISEPKIYNNVILEMTNGSFIVNNKATLRIQNCTIKGTLSKNNPALITLEDGNLYLENNKGKIKSVGVLDHPTTQSLYHVIQVSRGLVDMENNHFSVNNPFKVGLLITSASIPTTDYKIINNTFEKFHGVLYLLNSNNSLIQNNAFVTDTYGNIVTIGRKINILNNSIYFSGNNHLGNAIDVIDSDTVTISQNRLITPTCHGIYVLNSQNVVVDSNYVTGGITYAMTVLSNPETLDPMEYISKIIGSYKIKNGLSNNITITNNYMAQNRYGIAATEINTLNVQNNTFVQRFTDQASRTFWTDNNILIKDVTGLVWTNNLYKEAYTQDIDGNNTKSNAFVPFPVSGGVTL